MMNILSKAVDTNNQNKPDPSRKQLWDKWQIIHVSELDSYAEHELNSATEADSLHAYMMYMWCENNHWTETCSMILPWNILWRGEEVIEALIILRTIFKINNQRMDLYSEYSSSSVYHMGPPKTISQGPGR